MPKRVAEGVVTSDKMAKTRRVEIARRVRHPLYGKYIRRRTVCFVHDEDEKSHVGDRVEIIECRPLSKKKRWNLVRVVDESRLVDVAALRARASAKTADASDKKPTDGETEQADSPAENSESGTAETE